MVDKRKLTIELENDRVGINPNCIGSLLKQYPNAVEPEGKNWLTKIFKGGCVTEEALGKAGLILSTREKSTNITNLREEGAQFLISENMLSTVNIEDISKIRDNVEITVNSEDNWIHIGSKSSGSLASGSKYWTIDFASSNE